MHYMKWEYFLSAFQNCRNSDIADLISKHQTICQFCKKKKKKVNGENESYFHVSNHFVTAGEPFSTWWIDHLTTKLSF